jgi:Family of unknown function (DUF5947)
LDNGAPRSFAALQELLKRKPAPAPGERCDYCAAPVGPEHSHLIDLQGRRIMCACRPCYIVFEPEGAAQGRYKAVPTRFAEIEGFALDAASWDDLGIPIGLAFFFYNSVDKKMTAFYPGPAGATESLLSLEGWDAIRSQHPQFDTLLADVEAVLIDRRGDRQRCFIVPIDAAYELVGMLRMNWRGFDGGDEARAKIDGFFDRIGEQSRNRGRVTSRRV